MREAGCTNFKLSLWDGIIEAGMLMPSCRVAGMFSYLTIANLILQSTYACTEEGTSGLHGAARVKVVLRIQPDLHYYVYIFLHLWWHSVYETLK